MYRVLLQNLSVIFLIQMESKFITMSKVKVRL